VSVALQFVSEPTVVVFSVGRFPFVCFSLEHIKAKLSKYFNYFIQELDVGESEFKSLCVLMKGLLYVLEELF